MVSEHSGERIVARRGAKKNETTSAVLSGSDESSAMKEGEETTKVMNKVEKDESSATTEPQSTPGLLSRISGGVYDKTATVVGGVGWIAGTALSTSYSAVTSIGGLALRPFRKSPKDKAD